MTNTVTATGDTNIFLNTGLQKEDPHSSDLHPFKSDKDKISQENFVISWLMGHREM